ncbi:hypothetical protein CapIbe_015970 [Capra ibex]
MVSGTSKPRFDSQNGQMAVVSRFFGVSPVRRTVISPGAFAVSEDHKVGGSSVVSSAFLLAGEVFCSDTCVSPMRSWNSSQSGSKTTH